MPARLGRFQDILSCDKVSQHTFCPGTICRAKIRCSWVLMVGHFVPVMSWRVMTYCPRAKRRSGILLLAPPSQPSHTVSHVTLLVSGGKFASRLDFSGGRCFCSGGRLFFFRGAHPISAIFGTIDLDSLYFEVHIFLDPPPPPSNAQMCYFWHFLVVPL